MQSVFKKASIRSYEYVIEKPGKVFPKLANIKDFHFKGNVHNSYPLLNEHIWTALTTKPSRHKTSTTEDFVAPNRANDIVDD